MGGLSWWHWLVIGGAFILLFGAKKLPDLARGSGRALRIFKAETKGLLDDDEKKSDAQREIDARAETDAQRQSEAQRESEAQRRETTD